MIHVKMINQVKLISFYFYAIPFSLQYISGNDFVEVTLLVVLVMM